MGLRHRGAAARLGAGGSLALISLAIAACSPSAGTPSAPTTSGTAAAPTTQGASASPGGTTTAPRDWPMYHGDPSHTGLSSAMPNVTGQLKVITSIKLDGAVYASPIVVGGVVVVATENDSVYAFDTAGKGLWHVKVGSPSPASERDCGNINPLGITGTPIYSATTGDVYLVATHSGVVGHDLIALDLHTGQVRWRKNIDLPGPTPAAMLQRGALAITGGRVWVSFGGQYGDCSNYRGRVVGVKLDGTGKPVAYDPSPHRQGGIWNPAGPTLDQAGNMYVVSGNGSTLPGDAYDHTDSVLELSPSAKLLSSFAPTDWAQANAGDDDLGSEGVALVGTKWAVIGGKSGVVYVLRQGALGGIGGQVSGSDICLPFGGSAVYGSVVYLPCADGVAAARVDSAGKLHELWQADGSITGSPVVGGGRVWSLDQNSGVLHALDPANGQSAGQVSVGVTSRFATPAIYGSLLLVPTLTGVTYVEAS